MQTHMTTGGYKQRMYARRIIEKRQGADFSFRAASCGGVTVGMGDTTMRTGTMAKHTKPTKLSLTDQILNFCASGRFGVREAIAAVTTPKGKTKKQLARQHDLREPE